MTDQKRIQELEPLMEELGWWKQCNLCKAGVRHRRGHWLYMGRDCSVIQGGVSHRAHIEDRHALAIALDVAGRKLHKLGHHHHSVATAAKLRTQIEKGLK